MIDKRQYASRDKWLAARKEGKTIGASMVGAILGVDPHCSPYTAWARMSGLVPDQPPSIAMRRGLHDEPFVIDLYKEATGRDAYACEPFTLYVNSDWPFLHATPDAWAAVDAGPYIPLELKTGGQAHLREWKDGEPPLHNQLQLLAQMVVLGADKGALAGLIADEFFAVDRDRDDRVLASITPRLMEFWDRVLSGDPPPVDGSDSTTRTLKLMHPNDNGLTVQLPEGSDVWARKREQVLRVERMCSERKEYIDNQIRAGLGDATYGVTPGGLTFSLKTQTRTNPPKNWKEIVPKDQWQTTEYRVLRTQKGGAE